MPACNHNRNCRKAHPDESILQDKARPEHLRGVEGCHHPGADRDSRSCVASDEHGDAGGGPGAGKGLQGLRKHRIGPEHIKQKADWRKEAQVDCPKGLAGGIPGLRLVGMSLCKAEVPEVVLKQVAVSKEGDHGGDTQADYQGHGKNGQQWP